MNSRVVVAFVQYHQDQWWSNALQQVHLHKSNANDCWHHAQLYECNNILADSPLVFIACADKRNQFEFLFTALQVKSNESEQ
jgi:hypothetical protein